MVRLKSVSSEIARALSSCITVKINEFLGLWTFMVQYCDIVVQIISTQKQVF